MTRNPTSGYSCESFARKYFCINSFIYINSIAYSKILSICILCHVSLPGKTGGVMAEERDFFDCF